MTNGTVFFAQPEEDGENVSSDDSDAAPAKELPTNPEESTDRHVQGFTTVLSGRRNTDMYSFTRNIDYDRVTDTQKRRFLREKKPPAGRAGTSMQ